MKCVEIDERARSRSKCLRNLERASFLAEPVYTFKKQVDYLVERRKKGINADSAKGKEQTEYFAAGYALRLGDEREIALQVASCNSSESL